VEQWVRLCGTEEAPNVGEAGEFDAAGVAVCLANVEGKLCALDNWCPHRRGPLGQGWVEGNTIVCPWHAWAFDLSTGIVDPPESGRVSVFPVEIKDGNVMVNLG